MGFSDILFKSSSFSMKFLTSENDFVRSFISWDNNIPVMYVHKDGIKLKFPEQIHLVLLI